MLQGRVTKIPEHWYTVGEHPTGNRIPCMDDSIDVRGSRPTGNRQQDDTKMIQGYRLKCNGNCMMVQKVV